MQSNPPWVAGGQLTNFLPATRIVVSICSTEPSSPLQKHEIPENNLPQGETLLTDLKRKSLRASTSVNSLDSPVLK